MKIKCVSNGKIEYPKITHNKRFKWLKIDITTVIFLIILMTTVQATTEFGEKQSEPQVNPIRKGCIIVEFISTLMFIISGIMIIYKKIKTKKQDKEIHISKKIITVFIISIVLFILSKIGHLIL